MKSLPRAVLILGVVSFFTDFSSEMIYPLLPLFLAQVLGTGAFALGLIEGVAEATASLLKVVSGVWTDRVRRRKPLILAGYGLAGFVRPLIAFAMAWPTVLLLRFLDRVGKGIRSSPRDALIADVTHERMRGRAYGLHRSMDHAGAVVGPLLAAFLLSYAKMDLRQIFLIASVPALLAFLVLAFGIQEKDRQVKETSRQRLDIMANWRHFGARFKLFLLAVFIFTLGNSTDAFLLVRLRGAGVPAGWIALLWALHHIVKMLATYWGGKRSDRIGHKTSILFGWFFFALIYGLFAYVERREALIAVFLAYGIYYGFTEPAEKSLVSILAAKELRGTAFGCYHLVVGLGALPASLFFGLLWQRFGTQAAFLSGAALAALASFLLMRMTQKKSVP